MQRPSNIAARVGGWSARHRKSAIFGWLAFVILAFVIGSMVGTKQLKDADQFDGESKRAEKALVTKFAQPSGERVMIRSDRLASDDPEFTAALREVSEAVTKTNLVDKVRSATDDGASDLVSADHHTALVDFEIRGPSTKAEDKVAEILAAVAKVQAAHPAFRIEQFGDASANKSLNESFSNDLKKAETLSLPITLAILLVAFGAFVAAGIPILLAISSVLATLGLVAIPSHILPVDQNIASVVLLIGMAVGVDYSLFYIKRYREERAAGHDHQSALTIASATSGRAILVSGLTVVAAMSGLFLTGSAAFTSMGTGTMLVAAVAMLGSITVLPAVLSLLGPRVDKGRIPFVGRRLLRQRDSRLWGSVVDRVVRHPKAWGAVATVFLVALTIPVLGLKTGQSSVTDLPQDLPIIKTYNALEAAFPGGTIPAQVVEIGRAHV